MKQMQWVAIRNRAHQSLMDGSRERTEPALSELYPDPQGNIWQCLEIFFDDHHLGRGSYWPLNILKYTEQPPLQRNTQAKVSVVPRLRNCLKESQAGLQHLSLDGVRCWADGKSYTTWRPSHEQGFFELWIFWQLPKSLTSHILLRRISKDKI